MDRLGAPGRVLPESVVVAQTIREAALHVPGVIAMSPGRRYREATYGPGVTVWGVGISTQHGRIDADVHVVASVTPLPALAHRLRRTIQHALREISLLPVGQINIYIDDIVLLPDGASGMVPA